MVRFIPLGGIVGVTKNMYVYEIYKNKKSQLSMINDQSNREKSKYQNIKQIISAKIIPEEYELQDILIVDCGIGFPEAR
ncbi:hypothetical protein CO083_00570, partial [Candidatus Roizmanbacteria bacterium CG_4_9_14_0_8_um_filter_34_12]